MKKTISMLVIIAISLSTFSVVNAAETQTIVTKAAKNPTTLAKKSIYKELKEQKGILGLAITQHRSNLKNVVTPNDEITATQLLEEDTYSDGSIEKKYSFTHLLIVDKNGNKVGISQLESNSTNSVDINGDKVNIPQLKSTSTYSASDSTSSHTIIGSVGLYNLIDNVTAYSTQLYTSSTGITTDRCDKLQNTIIGVANASYSIKSLDCVFISCNDLATAPSYSDHAYVYNPTLFNTYTVYNPRPLFTSEIAFATNRTGVIITYNTGSKKEIDIDIKGGSVYLP